MGDFFISFGIHRGLEVSDLPTVYKEAMCICHSGGA